MELYVAYIRRVLMEVDALKSSGTKQLGDKPPATQSDSDHMLYQLRYRPEEAKFSSTARVGDRLTAIRKLGIYCYSSEN